MAQYKKIEDYANSRIRHPYPNDKIDPKLKREKEYYLSVVQAFISDYASNCCVLPFNWGTQRTIPELKAYATGRHPNGKLKKSILGNPKRNERTGQVGHVTKMNVSWETYMKLPQMFDVMRSKNMPQEYDVSLYCVDTDSLAAREQTKEMLKFIIDENTKKFIEKTGYKPNVQPNPEELGLMNDLDVDMYFETGGYTLEWERAAKAACLKTKQVSDYKILQDATFDDLITNPEGITGWKTYIEESTQLPKIRKVDMERAVIPSFTGNFFNGTRAAEIRIMTIADIRKENPTMSSADLMYIAKCFEWMNPGYASLLGGHFYDTSYLKGYNQNYDLDPISRVKVLVLDAQWLSTDIETNLKNINEKTGWKMFKEVSFDYQPDEKSKKKGDRLVKKNVIRKYYANWIIGTEHMISCGVCKDVVYYGEDGNKTPRLDYFFVKTGNASLVERAIAIVDDIDLIMFKHRNAWATLPAAPAMAIQKDLLENVFLNGILQQPEDIVQGLIERGILYYNGLDDNGKPLYFAGGQKPIDYMDVSKMAGMLSICSSEIALKVNELREVLGLQNGADGGQTSPYQGLGQTQLHQQNANASLVPTFNSFNYLFRAAFTDIVKKWQIVAKNKKGVKVAYSALGNHNMKVLELSGAFTNAEYNVDFKIGATLEEKQSILQMLADQKALGQQTEGSMGLTTSEWLYLYERVMSGNIEEAMFIMAKIEKKKLEARARSKQQDIQANAQVQQQSAEMKGQIDQALLQQKGQQEINNTMISELLKQNRELLNLMLAPKKEGGQPADTATAQGIIGMNNATVASIAQPQPEQPQGQPEMENQQAMQQEQMMAQ